jgi:hypothetical protein
MLQPAFNKPKSPGHCQSECCGDAGTLCDYLRNCRRGGHQRFFGTFHANGRFGHEEGGGEICARTVDGGAKVISCWSLTGHADMVPCNFWLFPKLKRPLKGKWFQKRKDIRTAMTVELNTILKEVFLEYFQQWWHRWEKCVEPQGDYFEGDYVSSTPLSLFFFPTRRSDPFLTDLITISRKIMKGTQRYCTNLENIPNG